MLHNWSEPPFASSSLVLGSPILTLFRITPDSSRSDLAPTWHLAQTLNLVSQTPVSLRSSVTLQHFYLSKSHDSPYIYLAFYLCVRSTCSFRPRLQIPYVASSCLYHLTSLMFHSTCSITPHVPTQLSVFVFYPTRTPTI